MFRNYLMASLRNLARNRLHSGISIFGLSVGLCGAMLAGVLLRGELGYDRFIPRYERTYLVEWGTAPAGRPRRFNMATPTWLAAQMRLEFGEIEAITRVAEQVARVKRGQVETKENIAWADPNMFDVLPLPDAIGDLRTALQRPDSVVLTRDAARKFFGRDDPIGESLLVDGDHPMRVTAIIESLPPNSSLIRADIYASGLAAHSVWSQFDTAYSKNAPFRFPGRTYLRLASGAPVDAIRRALPEFSREIFPAWQADSKPTVGLIRIDEVHRFPGFNPDVGTRLTIIAVVGVLILAIGCLNFINLTSARAARRALEVGVRKAAGASRGSLMVQFLGEALLYVALAAAIAIAATEWLLPHVNAFLDTNATFQYWRDPQLAACLVGGVVVVGLLAGAYPAFVLSAFRPAGIIRDQRGKPGGDRVRQCLVALQFAVLIALVIAAGVTYQQLRYATRDVLRVDTDQMLVVRSPCNAAFETEVRALAGVRGVACASDAFLTGTFYGIVNLKDGSPSGVTVINVQPGLFELFGLAPTSGRFFSTQRDQVTTTSPMVTAAGRMVINQAAVDLLGFGSPAAAIGQTVTGRSFPAGTVSEIVGTVSDFSLAPATQPIAPTIYVMAPPRLDRAFIKLRGHDIPETLAAVDKLWRATGAEDPIDRVFLNDHIQQLYVSVQRQTQTLTLFSVCALLLACLGLVGLAASAVERRTREIGVRKAMGAGTADVMRLLVWQVTKPVLWANLVAWPAAALIMSRWLHGFAYRVDLDPSLFVVASTLALLLALLTVSVHCYRVAREKPVSALRNE